MQKGFFGGLFGEFLTKESVFKGRGFLQSSYTPEEVIHREKELNQVAKILAPALKSEKPSNIFLYGKTGTGKTLTTKYVASELLDSAKGTGSTLKIINLNCKLKHGADTEYRLIAQILSEFGKYVPPTGLPTAELYKMFYALLGEVHSTTILILDEIDYLVKKTGDSILYNLTRVHEAVNSNLSIVGISNDVAFVEFLDPRVKSSLSEEEVIFPPYNALQIQDILRNRAALAFKNGVVAQGVLEKCAAYAAREHGDARRALELLRVAGEIADRNNQSTVVLSNIDEAESKIDRDRVYDIITTQPKQYNLILYSILTLHKKKRVNIFTGDVYNLYKINCTISNTHTLTQRRVSDIISEFDMLGIINAPTISKGRYGRTREINLEIEEKVLERIMTFLESEVIS